MRLKRDSELSEQELIDNLLLSGNDRRKAENHFFSAYSYLIREGMRKYSLSRDECFDAYSDTILSAMEKVINRSFEGRSSLKTFIYQIFHNKCVDLLRKRSTNKNRVHQTLSITDVMVDISDAAKSIIQRIIDKSDIDVLKLKLNEIGENCRQLLLLSAEGFTDKEIAVSVGYKTADVVKTSRLRCLEKLRQLYKSR